MWRRATPCSRSMPTIPDQLKREPPELVSAVQQATARSVRPFRDQISRNQTNWAVVAAAALSWAARVFPDVEPSRQVSQLWDAIGAIVPPRSSRSARRVGDAPQRSGGAHGPAEPEAVRPRCGTRVRGTDLTIGLPPEHIWVGGRSISASGIRFRAEPADRGSLHDAAQGSRQRHRAFIEAAQLRRYADRRLQRALCRRTRRRRQRRERAPASCGV